MAVLIQRPRHETAIDLVRLRDLFVENPSNWYSTRELAQRFEVSTRTMQRWLAVMEEIGLPLISERIPSKSETGKERCYRRFRR